MKFTKLTQNIVKLEKRKNEWAKVSLTEKTRYLQQLSDRALSIADQQIAVAIRAKGINQNSHLAGEEMLNGPITLVRTLRLLAESFEKLTQGLSLVKKSKVRSGLNENQIVDVFPQTIFEKLLLGGISGEVWLKKGQQLSTGKNTICMERPGKVALVLGAGNVSSIGPSDVIQKMFVENCVCILKMNEVNDYLGPFIEDIFKPLIDKHYFQVVYGDTHTGDFLCKHESIDEIHLTGSSQTYDAIVYGSNDNRQKRKLNDRPINQKPISSELGNVSPIIVIPGKWSKRELKFQVENIVTQMVNNAGFNCNACRIVITHKNWPQRKAFFAEIEKQLTATPTRLAYYPAAEEHFNNLVDIHPKNILLFGSRYHGKLPWGFIMDLDADDDNELFFTKEYFCGVSGEVSISGANAVDFLNNAVKFCNEKLWGTLNAGIIVDPHSMKKLGDKLEQAIANLRYGSIGINHWAAISYVLGVTTWGAFPGHTRNNIQSGNAIAHNTLLLEGVEKSVIRGPFTLFPKPLWFISNKAMYCTARQLLKFEHTPTLRHFLAVISAVFNSKKHTM